MLQRAEAVFFFLATVTALAWPAIPAVQEWRAAQQAAELAAAPRAPSQLVRAPAAPVPQQVVKVL